MHKRPPKKFVAFPFEYHQEIEVAIDSLTNLGAGVGRMGGWVVFVPFALLTAQQLWSHGGAALAAWRDHGRVDVTVGSALDLFGGKSLAYKDLVEWNRRA